MYMHVVHVDHEDLEQFFHEHCSCSSTAGSMQQQRDGPGQIPGNSTGSICYMQDGILCIHAYHYESAWKLPADDMSPSAGCSISNSLAG